MPTKIKHDEKKQVAQRIAQRWLAAKLSDKDKKKVHDLLA